MVLGLGIGLFTVKLAVDTIRKARAANTPTETVKTIRAKTDIQPQEKIVAEMVELIEIADNVLVPESERFDDLEKVV